MSTQQTSTAFRVLLTTAAFVVVVAGMQAAQTMLVPFLLSIFVGGHRRPRVVLANSEESAQGHCDVISHRDGGVCQRYYLPHWLAPQ